MLKNNLLEETQLFLQKLQNRNKQSNSDIDIALIETCIDYVKKYHKNQIRHSGDPYFLHLLQVADLTSQYYFDTESILSALLHDSFEDTKTSIEELTFLFGKNVAQIVLFVSKITGIYQLSKKEILVKLGNVTNAIEKKAIIIKIIDRLHNMRTLHYITALSKRKRIAQETFDFYIPMAKKYKLNDIATEFEFLIKDITN